MINESHAVTSACPPLSQCFILLDPAANPKTQSCYCPKIPPLTKEERGLKQTKPSRLNLEGQLTLQSAMSDETYLAPENPTSSPNPPPMILQRIMSKRRTWACLFVGVYTLLLSISWNFLTSVLAWYESTLIDSSSFSSSGSVYSGWPGLYASLLLGVAFGVLSMVAALAVAVPATLVTWITVLVLLTFFGKPRRDLVMEGKKLTAEITGFVVKVLIKEGNIVAALCAVIGYFVFVRKSKENSGFGVDS